MKIAYITAGAAGMFCGSCMRDNTLVRGLRDLGHDAQLIPTYTPIRTDEQDLSNPRVFFGGINVYLQGRYSFFRHTPWFLDRLLDGRRLLNWVSGFAVKTEASLLGELTLSMLRGEHGDQKKEVAKLVAWLKEEVRPDLVILTNLLLSGIVGPLHNAVGAPIVGMLQGDDIFLENLPVSQRQPAKDLIRDNCAPLAGLIATSHYYAEFMARYLDLPRDRIEVVHPGIRLDGFSPCRQAAEASAPATARPTTIGYFARIAPEKGLHHLVDAFCLLHAQMPDQALRLKVAGWLGEHNRAYLAEQETKLDRAGLRDDYERRDCPSHDDKARFLSELDLFSVPTTYREPKGLYVLEAWASGLPVVQPRHGSFPELIEATGAGLLVTPEDPVDLARGLKQLIERPDEARAMGRRGRAAAEEKFHADVMARETARVLERFHG